MRLLVIALLVFLLFGCSDSITGQVTAPQNGSNATEPVPTGSAPLSGGTLVRVDFNYTD